jgi:hypothetical protein
VSQYIDGFHVLEPPRSSGTRGGGTAVPNGLEVLQTYDADDFYSVEYFVCPGGIFDEAAAGQSGATPLVGYTEIHAYTHEYMERLARNPRVPLPACLP